MYGKFNCLGSDYALLLFVIIKLFAGSCHYTTKRDVPSILHCFCFSKGTKYGEGTYFAKSPSVSHGYTTPDRHGYRYMFKTCVLTGQYTRGTRGMLEPPTLPDQTRRYDSTVDNIPDPTVFVCFYDTHTYPQYLITYTQEASSHKCLLM